MPPPGMMAPAFPTRRGPCPRASPRSTSSIPDDERLPVPRLPGAARRGAGVEGPRHRDVLHHAVRGHPQRSCSTPSGSRTASATARATRRRRVQPDDPEKAEALLEARRSSADRGAVRGEGLAAGADARRRATSPSTCRCGGCSTTPSGPARVKELDPYVEELAYRLIDDFIDDGRCEWVVAVRHPAAALRDRQARWACPTRTCRRSRRGRTRGSSAWA